MKELHKKSSPLLLGILASALVALPVAPATFMAGACGLLAGDAWWAPIATVVAPLIALAIIIGAGVCTTKTVSRRSQKS